LLRCRKFALISRTGSTTLGQRREKPIMAAAPERKSSPVSIVRNGKCGNAVDCVADPVRQHRQKAKKNRFIVGERT
jgi:hypothetical protein